jgi:hypothetical protein
MHNACQVARKQGQEDCSPQNKRMPQALAVFLSFSLSPSILAVPVPSASTLRSANESLEANKLGQRWGPSASLCAHDLTCDLERQRIHVHIMIHFSICPIRTSFAKNTLLLLPLFIINKKISRTRFATPVESSASILLDALIYGLTTVCCWTTSSDISLKCTDKGIYSQALLKDTACEPSTRLGR